MHFLYNILIVLASAVLQLLALVNPKIKSGVLGRRHTFELLGKTLTPSDKTIWFHCASLGEYEQGLPVFEEVKLLYPSHKVVLSFFSPSGYEVKKHAPIADVVVYLPLDTKKNAKQFLDLVDPELSIFVKYEIWPNFLYELQNRKKLVILISALFRRQQIYFKFYGKFMRKAMEAFEYIFVQNEHSMKLLQDHGISQVTVAGDTRFDRVSSQLQLNNQIELIHDFKQNQLCLVAGSTWPEDEKLLVDYINSTTKKIKYIIAPHNIKSDLINQLKATIEKKTVLYSEMDKNAVNTADVLILNTIGMLSRVYSYADIAYVGGAMGATGLHNTLEAAVFGVPILIGPNYEKFPEAIDMIKRGGMFAVSEQHAFTTKIDELVVNSSYRQNTGLKNADYVKKNTGAVIQIMDFIRKYAV